MKNYELMLVIKPDLADTDAKKISATVLEVIKKAGAKELKEDFWGKRKLAYTIKNFNEAFYSVINFQAEADKAASLKTQLNLNDNLLRYLLTVVE